MFSLIFAFQQFDSDIPGFVCLFVVRRELSCLRFVGLLGTLFVSLILENSLSIALQIIFGLVFPFLFFWDSNDTYVMPFDIVL